MSVQMNSVVVMRTFFKRLDNVIEYKFSQFGLDEDGPNVPDVLHLGPNHYTFDKLHQMKDSEEQVAIYNEFHEDKLEQIISGNLSRQIDDMAVEEQLKTMREEFIVLKKRNLSLVNELNKFASMNKSLIQSNEQLANELKIRDENDYQIPPEEI